MECKTPYRVKAGDHRERLKFAWWPTGCADGKTRWLCKIRILEVYEGPSWNSYGGWRVSRSYRAEVELR